jgi:hypothetical protein
MRKLSIFLIVVLLLAFILLMPAYAQEAAPEWENSYGTEGTMELGLNGSIAFPFLFVDAPDGFPEEAGPTTITLQPFFKYFFQDRIHADVTWLLSMSEYEEIEGVQAESEQTISVLFPSVGYTYPLTPRLQVDASINLGLLSYTIDDESDSAFSYGFTLMALSPISESAVLGVGLVFTWSTIGYGNEDVTLLQRTMPIQVSFYF